MIKVDRKVVKESLPTEDVARRRAFGERRRELEVALSQFYDNFIQIGKSGHARKSLEGDPLRARQVDARILCSLEGESRDDRPRVEEKGRIYVATHRLEWYRHFWLLDKPKVFVQSIFIGDFILDFPKAVGDRDLVDFITSHPLDEQENPDCAGKSEQGDDF